MKTANEIALEAKVSYLEQEIKYSKDFESKVMVSFGKLMIGVMSNDPDVSRRGLEELTEILKARAEKTLLDARNK